MRDNRVVTQLKVRGEIVLNFDPKNGTLALSASGETCSILKIYFGISEGNPVEVVIPGEIIDMPEDWRYKMVRNIVSLPPGEDGHHFDLKALNA